jgi:hypothetical protein
MHKEDNGAMPTSLPRRDMNNANCCWVVWVKMLSQVDSSNEAMKRVRELETAEASEIHSLFFCVEGISTLCNPCVDPWSRVIAARCYVQSNVRCKLVPPFL